MSHHKMARIQWTHPKRRMEEILCNRHEHELISALKVVAIGCIGERADECLACMRCAIEASGQDPRFAYGLTGA